MSASPDKLTVFTHNYLPLLTRASLNRVETPLLILIIALFAGTLISSQRLFRRTSYSRINTFDENNNTDKPCMNAASTTTTTTTTAAATTNTTTSTTTISTTHL